MIDFTITGGGSVYLLHPNTEAARSWIQDHIGPEALRWGNAIAVEHRYVDHIAEGIAVHGLSLEAA